MKTLSFIFTTLVYLFSAYLCLNAEENMVRIQKINIGDAALVEALDDFIKNHVDTEKEQVTISFKKGYDKVFIVAIDKAYYSYSSRTLGYTVSNGIVVYLKGDVLPYAKLEFIKDSWITIKKQDSDPIVDGCKEAIYFYGEAGNLIFEDEILAW